MKSVKSNKGFTLVELLAVLVVLALLMVLALPAVLNASTNAQRNAFQQQVRKYVEAAETKYNTASIEGGTPASCYSTLDLMPDLTEYHGCVIIGGDGTTTSASVYGNSYYVEGVTRKQIYGSIASTTADDKFVPLSITAENKDSASSTVKAKCSCFK